MAESNGAPLTLRQQVVRRKSALYKARTTWDRRWHDISQNLLPFSGRFQVTDRNRGDKDYNRIIDETAGFALGILAAGMQSGMTSPARPWFRLALTDTDLMESETVKYWLADVTQLMRDVFSRGNTYRSLHTLYEELGAFGTAVNVILPDYENVIWHDPLTIGEYAISTDKRGKVNTLVREYELTVEQVVGEFVMQPNGSMDWSVVSSTVRNMWDTYNYDAGVSVIHLVQPRALSQRGDQNNRISRQLPRNLPVASVYIESGQENNSIVLRESGFRESPVLGARWHTRGGDVYGVGPGMNALGSIKQLQQEQLRKGQAVDYMARPPIAIPNELKGKEIDTLPGGVNYFSMTGGNKIQNLFDVRMDIGALLEDIRDVRERINRHFYADLFLMISQDTRNARATATEIAERHEEKLLMLGPVLERLHDELLGPTIDITFERMLNAGMLPPPPPELSGMDLKVEFVSVLAQAQRAVGLASLDRLLGTIGSLASASGDSSVWDKIDKDEAIERYADMLAVDPELIVGDEKVALIRAERQKASQAQQMAEQAQPMAAAAKSMAEAQEISAGAPAGSIDQFTGYTP